MAGRARPRTKSATEIPHALVRQVEREPARHPSLSWLLRHFPTERMVLGGWGPLSAELGRFAGEHFGVRMDSGFGVALQVNELLMPRPGRCFPEVHALAHDFVGWLRACRRTRKRPAACLVRQAPSLLRPAGGHRPAPHSGPA
jgi:hypothetical protein